MSGREVVLDTVVLSNFAATGSVGVLLETLDSPITVTAVRDELDQGVTEGYDHLERATDRWETGYPSFRSSRTIGSPRRSTVGKQQH